MLRFGIWTREQYLHAGAKRRFSGARVSYSLLNVGDHPTEEEIKVFEDICFTLRTSNGTFRTSFRRRFHDVDAAAMCWIERLYPAGTELRVQDRAVSHGLTSREWAEQVFQVYPRASFEASDLLFFLVQLTLPDGASYIVEPNGQPLQYIRPPFVVSVLHREPRRYPVNRWMRALARRRFARLSLPEGWMESAGAGAYRVGKIPIIHPEALLYSKTNPGFQFRVRSVFEHTPGACQVLRTMNIFNRDYFPEEQLRAGMEAAFHSLEPGGLWIVGRTLEEDFSNHVSFLRRRETGWEFLERVGKGSEMEALALGR